MFSVICFLTTLHLIGPVGGPDTSHADTLQVPLATVRALERIPLPNEITRPNRIAQRIRRYDDGLPGATRKSPVVAGLLSTGATVLPFGGGLAMVLANDPTADDSAGLILMLGGFVVGPAMGHFYSENSGRAFDGIVGRGMMLVMTGFTFIVNPVLGGILGIPLTFGMLGSLFSDLASAADAARAYNARHGFGAQADVSVAPQFDPIHRQAGLALRWTF